jgi:hypothetical protein
LLWRNWPGPIDQLELLVILVVQELGLLVCHLGLVHLDIIFSVAVLCCPVPAHAAPVR